MGENDRRFLELGRVVVIKKGRHPGSPQSVQLKQQACDMAASLRISTVRICVSVYYVSSLLFRQAFFVVYF